LTTLTNYTAEFFSASRSLQDFARPDTTKIYPQITLIAQIFQEDYNRFRNPLLPISAQGCFG